MFKALSLSYFLACALVGTSAFAATSDLQNKPGDSEIALPELGDASSGLISTQQEYKLGRAWLKSFRGQVKTVADPLMQSYLEDLVYDLARHSELTDRRLEVVVVDNPTINAFAVPGGIVGVHNGLFLHADNESQLAGVLGHELAHLSQRHFARSVDKQREASVPTLAALLAGIVLAATTGGDAGIAAIAAGQAAAIQSQLRFSREHEQEADRIGMETLAEAGMDPGAIPAMFEKMNQMSRFSGQKPPEFLLTHPLTESRINDGRNRARQYPRRVYTDNLTYQLMKARATLALSSAPSVLLKQWQHAQQSNPSEATSYGIVLALNRLGRWGEARKALEPLLAKDSHRPAYVLAAADIEMGENHFDKAVKLLRSELALAPDNHPITMKLAEALRRADRAPEAEEILERHSRQRPNDPDVWFELAEVHGLAGNILGVHFARAEYYILNGLFDNAEKQLHYAFPLARNNHITERRIKQRLRDIQELRNTLKEL